LVGQIFGRDTYSRYHNYTPKKLPLPHASHTPKKFAVIQKIATGKFPITLFINNTTKKFPLKKFPNINKLPSQNFQSHASQTTYSTKKFLVTFFTNYPPDHRITNGQKTQLYHTLRATLHCYYGSQITSPDTSGYRKADGQKTTIPINNIYVWNPP